MAQLTGACHCGRVKVSFEIPGAPEKLQLRACGCTFCRKHGARTVSDPGGRLTFLVETEAAVRYRFALRSADFIICRHCGVYVGVIMTTDDRTYGVVNVNVLDDSTPFDRPPEPMNYAGETAEARTARRKKFWSPAELIDIRPA